VGKKYAPVFSPKLLQAISYKTIGLRCPHAIFSMNNRPVYLSEISIQVHQGKDSYLLHIIRYEHLSYEKYAKIFS
jgi:hypothetical protein